MNARRPGDFRTGIAIPLLRSAAMVAGLVIAARLAGNWAGDQRWFFGVLLLGILAFWLLDSVIRPNKAAERAASRRWFGVEEQR